MLLKDDGVVLRSARSGETSKLVTFLGRDGGKMKLIGKGALSAKSPFRGALEAGNRLEAVFYQREGRNLSFLKEVTVVAAVRGEGASIERMATVLAALELLDRVCYWGSPEPRILDVACEFLGTGGKEDPLCLYLAFELKLLERLGVLPNFKECSSCGERILAGFYHPAEGGSLCAGHTFESPHRIQLNTSVLAALERLTESPLGDAPLYRVGAAERKKLGKILHWTYTFHIQGYALPQALKLITKNRDDR